MEKKSNDVTAKLGHFIKGGYKIIDFGGVDISSGATITGIYEAFESANTKPILVTGMKNGDVELKDFFANAQVFEGKFHFPIGSAVDDGSFTHYDVIIDDDDYVSISSINLETPKGKTKITLSESGGTLTDSEYDAIYNHTYDCILNIEYVDMRILSKQEISTFLYLSTVYTDVGPNVIMCYKVSVSNDKTYEVSKFGLLE